MIYSIDRFEGGYAVCEEIYSNVSGRFVNIDRNLLPDKAREGDLIEKCNDGFKLLDRETQRRKIELLKKQQQVFNKKTKL